MRVIVADQECFDDEGGNQRWQQSVLGLLLFVVGEMVMRIRTQCV